MFYRNLESNRNICRSILLNGGELIPLLINTDDSGGTGLMNPSILNDNGSIIINLRNVNYTLYHAEGKQLYNNRYGPLAYLHPEDDQHLRTTNFLMKINPDLSFLHHYKIHTDELDIKPVWEFVGLEDIRLVRWEGDLYGCGVRRDVYDNGQGRMELSKLEFKEDGVVEVSRNRIEPPKDPDSYCEKNWMPVIDQPFTFIKWTNPTEVVKVNLKDNSSISTFLDDFTMDNIMDLRGGSQVIPFRDHYLCIVHDCDLFRNKLDQKDATYMHRWIVWDRDWRMVHMSDPWSFMDGEIEFCCGLCEFEGDLLVTFGFQDNAAYLLKIPGNIVNDILGRNVRKFAWGDQPESVINHIRREVLVVGHYEKHTEVKAGDVVVDVGANVGAFAEAIMIQDPGKVYCLEPSAALFPILCENIPEENVVMINQAIGPKSGTGSQKKDDNRIYGLGEGEYQMFTWMDFIAQEKITTIDFLKVDAEGAEYDIFNQKNKEWILENVKHAVVECHMQGIPGGLKKFKQFRETYLSGDTKFFAIDSKGVEIKDRLFQDEYVDAIYKGKKEMQFLIYLYF